MKSQLTKIIEKHGDWYVGYIREIPGVNTQGRTLSEARRNLEEALSLVIEANRRLSSNRRKKTPRHCHSERSEESAFLMPRR